MTKGVSAFFEDIEYPIFNESYRKGFQERFVRNFYMREIGFETEYLFKFQLETWLQINMPYFNQLFESELIKYDPLETINKRFNQNVDKTQDSSNNQKSTTDKNSNSKGWTHNDVNTTSQVHNENDSTSNTEDSFLKNTTTDTTVNKDDFSRILETDTPDNRLAITTDDGNGVIEYASNIKEDKSKSTENVKSTGKEDGTNSSVTNAHNNFDENVSGNQIEKGSFNTDFIENVVNDVNGNQNTLINEKYFNEVIGKDSGYSYQELVKQLRMNFLRIERDIFKEMNELFMLTY